MCWMTRVVLVLAAALCAPVRGHISSADVSDSVQHAPEVPLPASPCPRVFQYEPSPSGATGWAGVVRLQTPSRFSSLRLSVHLASPEHVPADPAPGTLTLRGGVAQARALVRAVHRGHRTTVEFVADFSPAVTLVPALLNVTVNGRLFCASQEPAGTRSTITLVSDLDTGLDSVRASDEDFSIAPERDVVAVDRPGQDAAQDAAPTRAWTLAPASSLPPATAAPEHLFIPQDAFRPDSFVLPSVDHSPTTATAPPYSPLPAEEASAAGVTWPQPERHAPEGSPAIHTLPPDNPPPHTPTPDTSVPHTPSRTSPEATDTYRSPLLHRTHQDECGRAWSGANPLVTRGAAAVRGRWPWLVALFKKLGRRDQVGLNFECGASLVSERHVITGEHTDVTNAADRHVGVGAVSVGPSPTGGPHLRPR
ncbi:uncharacterized protein LOC113202028 [Frankliniella occidentalis]|uniref:Uncharacterized protein LOC113202028 n=1 Tax=Frankliniella occidentalis TaxID=133901 RepID=A0A6J1RU22_FRAOC|nr:uncharacterized protein LOC113202028 [Frankliniella occidentalis]